MNLAWKDIRRQKGRFALTALGLGLLFAIVLAMGGIYRGLVEDATLLVDRMNADLWIVQRDTRGPFAERSTVPGQLEDRLRAVPGVASTRRFSNAIIQREHHGRSLRMNLVGLSWPGDGGEGLPLAAGRILTQAHRELIADRSLGLSLGERVHLGNDDYTVVGLTKGLLGSGGDGVALVSESDAASILAYQPPEALRIEREARVDRLSRTDFDTPANEERLRSDGGALPALAPPPTNAILVKLIQGARVEDVQRTLAGWREVTATSTEEQRQFLLQGVVEKSKKQIGLFRALLAIVSGIIVALIVFNMTAAKARDIALLKLMGAKTGVVVGLILEQSLMLGGLGYLFAFGIAELTFQYWPRRVVVGFPEFAGVAILVGVITLVSSLAGVRRALKIPPTLVLAG
jgi:putative ABC transport system permease protein